jgi:hypothetical protein
MNPESITCSNNYEYSFNSGKNNCFYGYVENMIYAIKEAQKHTPNSDNIFMWIIDCMFYIYTYYLECVGISPEHSQANLEWCKLYYKEVYKEIEESIPEEVIVEFYNDAMKKAYLEDRFVDFIPELNFYEFLDKLK